MKRIILALAFLSTIPLANWMVGHVGTTCPAYSPCLVPVWPVPLIYAPSGSVIMGIALVLRNLLQQVAPRGWILGAIILGTIIAAFVAPGALVLGSATSFFFSEMADWGVYSPLRNRFPVFAVLAAGTVGSVIDSTIFVWLAFGGHLTLIEGQFIAKIWASIFAACLIATLARKTPNHDRVSVT